MPTWQGIYSRVIDIFSLLKRKGVKMMSSLTLILIPLRTISLLSILSSFLSNKTINGAYASAGYLISVMQTVAVLEVPHGAIGIVPSGFLFLLMQWSGRTHFILTVVGQISDSPRLSITLVAWCFGENLKAFFSFAEGEVKSLASLYSTVDSLVPPLLNCFSYFGEHPERVPFEQGLSVLPNFRESPLTLDLVF